MRGAILGALAFLFVSGCVRDSAALPVTTITVDTLRGQKALTVELAGDSTSQERGLMYRSTMAPDAGMLFDFHTEMRLTFWMKNTILPLDMLFIHADGTISSIEPNAVPYSTAPIPSLEPVRAVLELNGGRAHELGIRVGDKVHASIFHNTQ